MTKKEQTLNKANAVLREIEAISTHQFLPIIGPKKGIILADEVHKAKPKNVLEVGTLIGYSAVLICKELGADAHFTSVEQHLDEAEMAKANIAHAQIAAQTEVIVGDALEVLPTLQCCFDFAFIDAAKDEYYQYLKLAEDKLTKGATIVADNAGIFASEMKDYLKLRPNFRQI